MYIYIITGWEMVVGSGKHDAVDNTRHRVESGGRLRQTRSEWMGVSVAGTSGTLRQSIVLDDWFWKKCQRAISIFLSNRNLAERHQHECKCYRATQRRSIGAVQRAAGRIRDEHREFSAWDFNETAKKNIVGVNYHGCTC